MSDSDKVEAIIVIGPILWKCVQCDLLVSRQHSIDNHLRLNHTYNQTHSTLESLEKKCDILACACQQHYKWTGKSKIQLSGKKQHFDQDNSIVPQFLHKTKDQTLIVEDEESDTTPQNNSDDEIPPNLREIVEKAVNLKENNCCDNNLLPSERNSAQMAEAPASGDSDTSIIKNNFTKPDDACQAKDVQYMEDGSTFSSNNSNLKNSLKRKICESNSRLQDSFTDTNSLEKLNTERICHEPDLVHKDQLDGKTNSDISNENIVSVGRDNSRRTSNRANKGKSTYYQEYRLDPG